MTSDSNHLERGAILNRLISFSAVVALSFGFQTYLAYQRVLDDGYASLSEFRIFLWPALIVELKWSLPNIMVLSAITVLLAYLFKRNRETIADLLYALCLFYCIFIYPILYPTQMLFIALAYLILVLPLILLLSLILRIGIMSRIGKGFHYVFPKLLWGIGGIAAVFLTGFHLFQWNVSEEHTVSPVPDKPDILFILVDAMRADVLEKTVDGRYLNPNMMRLAKNGAVFTRAYAPSYFTGISLPAIFTGRLPSFFEGKMTLMSSPDNPTFVQKAFENGYQTAAITASGFVAGTNLDRYFQSLRWIINPMYTRPILPAIMDYYDRKNPGLSLLYVHFIDCHEPYLPFRKYRDSSIGFFDMWKTFYTVKTHRDKEMNEFQTYRELYEDEVSQIDDQIGMILERLEKAGRLADTVIIITADHGEAFLEHGILVHEAPAFFNEIMQVPLIVHYPKAMTAGVRIHRPISIIRCFDLISELVQGNLPADRFVDDLYSLTSREVLADNGWGQLGFIQDPYKLVHFEDTDYLFNLETDPEEKINLAEKHPEILSQMKERANLIQLEAKVRAKADGITEGPEMDSYIKNQLKTLGYFND